MSILTLEWFKYKQLATQLCVMNTFPNLVNAIYLIQGVLNQESRLAPTP